jgi:hypothetical protein
MFVCIRHGFEVMASVSSELDPLWAGSFSAVRGCCISSHEASLMMWYVTALPSLAVSVCVSNYMIQAGLSGLIGDVPTLPLRGSRFPHSHAGI